MKLHKIVFSTVVMCLVSAVVLCSGAAAENSSKQAAGAKPFLGRWDITLKAPDREYPSWLEVSDEDGELKAQMVGRWGNARPLPKVEVSGGELSFVSPKEEEDSKQDLVFKGKVSGGRLTGTLNGPDGKE
jgi:hypothetical protein